MLFADLLCRKESLSVVGLGYVGMPIAVAFAKKVNVVGFDLNSEKIELYKKGVDPTNEVGDDVIKNTEVFFTSDENKLKAAKFHIVAVPTPVNDDMGKYVAENCVKNLIAVDKSVKNARVAILGFTFKENCPDTRNTKVIDIVNELREYGINPVVADPEADAEEAKRLYGLEFVDVEMIKDMDAVILAVAHDKFASAGIGEMDKLFGNGKKVLLDIKGLLNRKEYEEAGYKYWRL